MLTGQSSFQLHLVTSQITQMKNPIVSFRRSYYAANWASFTFNGLLNWIQQYQVSIKVFFLIVGNCQCLVWTNWDPQWDHLSRIWLHQGKRRFCSASLTAFPGRKNISQTSFRIGRACWRMGRSLSTCQILTLRLSRTYRCSASPGKPSSLQIVFWLWDSLLTWLCCTFQWRRWDGGGCFKFRSCKHRRKKRYGWWRHCKGVIRDRIGRSVPPPNTTCLSPRLNPGFTIGLCFSPPGSTEEETQEKEEEGEPKEVQKVEKLSFLASFSILKSFSDSTTFGRSRRVKRHLAVVLLYKSRFIIRFCLQQSLQVFSLVDKIICPITQAPQVQGEEPEADQSQSEPAKKKITYAQLVKEGRRFNIDLVSKVTQSQTH